MIDTLMNAMNATGSEWVLWLLFALSIASLAVIAERAWFLWKRRLDLDTLSVQVATMLREGRHDELAALLRREPGMAPQVALELLAEVDASPEAREDLYRSSVERHRLAYERSVGFLATLGSNAPFIGLFGTVLGIISAFADLEAATAGANRSQVIMGSISEALVATAVGLLVAIPAVVAYNYFQQRIEAAVSSTEVIVRQLMARSRPTVS